jgi:hypothetical protein
MIFVFTDSVREAEPWDRVNGDGFSEEWMNNRDKCMKKFNFEFLVGVHPIFDPRTRISDRHAFGEKSSKKNSHAKHHRAHHNEPSCELRRNFKVKRAD